MGGGTALSVEQAAAFSERRHVRRACESQVDDVTRAQVDLGGAARTFTDHDVEAPLKVTVSLENDVQQFMLFLPTSNGVEVPHRATELSGLSLATR